MNNKVVMKGKRSRGLYFLEAKTVIGNAEISTKDDSDLWHRRLGHVGEKSLQELQKQGALKNSTAIKISTCDDCILGKSQYLPYGKSNYSASKPLEYIHADLWGPSRTDNMGGERWFLSIIDDYSRKL
ncbi:uncharacterized mitochondrial protein AtMg00300-like [Salvia miltiorrhiza]|uniref:uncharacterized mitochondrial protein AtMg00300-like n=1 Tax=Salvia miltiorrhiza TaxID=226208 RepID=UPI0025ACECDC|nr:uncharacterized mitochondrial protein AtMg00300-like [Salvia miltiorrhiza]